MKNKMRNFVIMMLLQVAQAEAAEQTKAPRLTATAPVVGPAAQTNPNLYSVTELLKSIKTRIDCLGNEITECCACQFFITQNTPGPRNHLVNDPITVPGVYCLAEDVTGTIVIETSNVTIHFNGHTLTGVSNGVVSLGNNNISIDGGTITGADLALSVQNGFDITLSDMTLRNNIIGLRFENISNFNIQNCPFIQNTGTSISLFSSQSGAIAGCTVSESISEGVLTLVTIQSCSGLQWDALKMYSNAAQELTGMSVFDTHYCSWRAVQFNDNAATSVLNGIYLNRSCENRIDVCDIVLNSVVAEDEANALITGIQIVETTTAGSSNHNQLTNCTVNNNTLSASQNAFFVGIAVGCSISTENNISDSCQNTVIWNTTIQNNEIISEGMGAFFSGMSIGTAIGSNATTLAADNVAANSVIDGCLINNNSCVCVGTADFSGLTFAGITAGGTVGVANIIGDNAAENIIIRNCTVNNNVGRKGPSDFSGAILSGISLSGNIGGNSVIGNRGCVNGVIENCTVNNNNVSFEGGNDGAAFFYGINIGSAIGGGGTAGSDIGLNCFVLNSAINNNICTSGGSSLMIGFNFAGNFTGGGSTGFNACSNCLLRNGTVNNNVCTAANFPLFAGIAMGAMDGGSSNNSRIEGITVCSNIAEGASANLNGVILNGRATSFEGGCNNITCSNCLVELNSTGTAAGNLYGFYIDGTGTGELAGGCNNIIFRACEVHANSGASTSEGYYLTTNAGDNNGLRNIQFQDCSAKQNTGLTLNGFAVERAQSLVLEQCVSMEHPGNGFRLLDVVDSALRECKATDNRDSGFLLAGTTNNVTLTNGQALGNGIDGFTLQVTTTACFVRENIAQNNNSIGFNNLDTDEWKHQFFSNFAQANGASAVDNYQNVPLVENPIVDPTLVTAISNIST